MRAEKESQEEAQVMMDCATCKRQHPALGASSLSTLTRTLMARIVIVISKCQSEAT